MEVAILGAGIAGLMSAITLRAQGQHCRIYERSRQAQDAGMGFILVPEAISRLESFGVHLTGAVGGTSLERYLCRDSAGQIVFEQAMPAGSRGIRRRDLIAALIRALGDEDALVFAEADGLEFSADCRVNSVRIRSRNGVQRIRAALYVGAEGVNSQARLAIFPDWPTTTDQVPEFVGLVRCNRAVAWAAHNLNKFHSVQGGLALGILPVDEQHVVWYLQFDSQRFPMSHEVIYGGAAGTAGPRRAFIEGLVGAWAHPIPSLLANTDFCRVHLWRPVETDLIPRFHRENLVLVGDAAHPLSPFTSQGVSSAIADAVVLAGEVNRVSSPSDLAQALEQYSRERHEQCAPYLAKGRDLVRRFLEPLSQENAILPIAVQPDHSPIVGR